MNALEAFQKSNAWDERYGLPLVPMHNNPHLYSAYALKIIRKEVVGLKAEATYYYWICMVGEMVGLINRWPNGKGGLTSFDEIMGAAHSMPGRARVFLMYLDKHWGQYNNTGEKHWNPLKFNIYKFLYMRPYLSGVLAYTESKSIGVFSQVIWSLLILAPGFMRFSKPKSNFGGYLRAWLMCDHMEHFKLSGWFIKKWKAKMKRLDFGPKDCFAHYLTECPVFYEWAPKEF